MDATSITSAVQSAANIGTSFDASHFSPTPPVAPPELASKFQELMARAATTSAPDAAGSMASQTAVAGVENHLKHHSEILDRVVSVNAGEMSLAELQVVQMQSTIQLGMMSMTQAAYMQVLGSSKSSVSALMKNQ